MFSNCLRNHCFKLILHQSILIRNVNVLAVAGEYHNSTEESEFNVCMCACLPSQNNIQPVKNEAKQSNEYFTY